MAITARSSSAFDSQTSHRSKTATNVPAGDAFLAVAQNCSTGPVACRFFRSFSRGCPLPWSFDVVVKRLERWLRGCSEAMQSVRDRPGKHVADGARLLPTNLSTVSVDKSEIISTAEACSVASALAVGRHQLGADQCSYSTRQRIVSGTSHRLPSAVSVPGPSTSMTT